MASTRLPCLLVTIAALTAAPASARQGDGATHDAQRLSALHMITELRTLQLRMQNLANLVMQENAAVADEWQLLQRTLETSASATDPATMGHLERLQVTRDAVEQAAGEGDQNRLQQLLEERRLLTLELMATQTVLMAHPDVAARLAAFRTAVLSAMRATVPDLDDLLIRMRSLAEQLCAGRKSPAEGGNGDA